MNPLWSFANRCKIVTSYPELSPRKKDCSDGKKRLTDVSRIGSSSCRLKLDSLAEALDWRKPNIENQSVEPQLIKVKFRTCLFSDFEFKDKFRFAETHKHKTP